jgi:HlyD family secretion protein
MPAMPQRKTLIWIAIGIVLLASAAYFLFFRKAKVTYNTVGAAKGELAQTVSVTGTLKSDETISLNFETTGRIREVRARVGQTVAKGDVLAVLNDVNLRLSADQAKANLDKARAEAGVNNDLIHTSEVSVENAENYFDDTKSLNKKNIAAAEQKVSDAKNYFDDAETYYNKVKDDSGSDSSAAKLAKLTLDTAQANYEQAKDARDVADQTADLAETSAQNSLNTSKANLAAAKSKYVSAASNATVQAFEAAYETSLNNLDKATLLAPAAGVIKEVNFKAGEVFGGTISNINTAGDFAKMISFEYTLEAKVPESDIAKIKVGQPASVAFDAFSANDKFGAKVASIEPSATVVQDVVDYVVKLVMDSSDVRFKDGMSADIDISIQKKEGVISIPDRAIQDSGGKKMVQILVSGKPVDREVKLGLEGDGGMVEIVSGLSEGDQVITSTK